MKWLHYTLILASIIAAIAFGFIHNWFAMTWAIYTTIYAFLWSQDEKEIKQLNQIIKHLTYEKLGDIKREN